MTDRLTDPPVGSSHWFEEHALFVRYLIVRHTHHGMEVLSSADDEAILPVFSTKPAAGEYLRSRALGPQWQIRESTAGELISLLMGHIADVDLVALDLAPESSPGTALGTAVGEGVLFDSLSKTEFIDSLMQEPMLMSPR